MANDHGFPGAHRLGQQAKGRQKKPGFTMPARQSGRTKISLQAIRANLDGTAADKYISGLEADAKTGFDDERREASLTLAIIKQMRSGSLDKHFLESNPTVFVDDSGDLYGKQFGANHIADAGGLDLSGVEQMPEYESDMPTGLDRTRQEIEARKRANKSAAQGVPMTQIHKPLPGTTPGEATQPTVINPPGAQTMDTIAGDSEAD